MNISAPAIERPVATSLLTFALLLAGALAYTQLPVAPLPQIDFPVISVGAGLPGASPETMASSVATPLERQFGRIAGINQMTSSSSLGSTGVTMQFDLDRNIDAAARDVQAAINAARGYLPADLPSNPSYRKINPADAPVMILAMTSDALTQDQMYDAADSVMGQKLAQVEGVGQVFVWGSSQPAVRIEANPNLLNKLNVGLEAVRSAVASQNANIAKGAVDNGSTTWMVRANDQLKKAADYRPIIVAYRNGSPVRLSDVADVQDSYSNINNAGSFNGKPSVLVVIFRQPGANMIATADRVAAALPFLKASLPAAINLVVGLDRTTTVRASVADVQRTLVISVILVTLVVFVFLREVRATMIPSVAVPLAIVGTFGSHVSVRLLAEQSLADGADHLHRVRGGRRHCGAGKRNAPRRGRDEALSSRTVGRTRNRLHRGLHEHVADRGVHSHSADGRHGRAAVPRVCRDSQRRHCGFAGGLAHHHADAVRPLSEGP